MSEAEKQGEVIARRDSAVVPIPQCCVSVPPCSVMQILKSIIDRDAGGALSGLY